MSSELGSPTIISTLFVHQDALERHLTAPRLRERERYLAMLQEEGHSKRFIAERASLILHVQELVRTNSHGRVEERQVAQALLRWKARRGCEKARAFPAAARSWFRFLGLYTASRTSNFGYSAALAEFARELRKEGRYARATVEGSLPPVATFLRWSAEQTSCLSELTLAHLKEFFATQVGRGWSRRTLSNAARSLRMFFRFAEQRGWSNAGLSRTVRSASVARRSKEAMGPSWRQVRQMLDSLDCSDPSQCRAKAILLLASIYGLRRCELARLTLDDLDWKDQTLTIRRAKRGRVQRFPIQPEVGEAITRYLQTVRAQSGHRNLFLTLKRPYRPVPNLGSSMRKVLRSSGAFERDWGLHALRHACATELLRKGSSLRAISSFLGHRDLCSVSIYARSDESALKQVADFDLSDLV